jgi:hypothetical protein
MGVVVVEEADEAILWLELLTESGIVRTEKTESLLSEARELDGDLHGIAANGKGSSLGFSIA